MSDQSEQAYGGGYSDGYNEGWIAGLHDGKAAGREEAERATLAENERCAKLLEAHAERNPRAEFLNAMAQVCRCTSPAYWRRLRRSREEQG